MAQGGGRGWFRRRTHSDSADSARENTAESGAEGGVEGGAEIDSSAMPSRDHGVADASAESDAFAELVRGRPAADASSVGEGGPLASPPGATAVDSRSPSTPPGRAPTRAAIDWDAATAAALADDGNEVTGPTELVAPAGGSNAGTGMMLDEIIREIVGDAAVDTASSLHPVAVAPAESVPPADATAAPTDPEATIVPSAPAGALPAATPVAQVTPDGPTAAVVPDALVDPAAPVATSETVAPDVSLEPVAPETKPAADAVSPPPVSERPTAPPPLAPPASPATVSTIAPTTSSTPTPTAPDDVSRETPQPHGGTPLADELMNETRRRIALEEAVLPLPQTTRVLTISNQKGGVGKTTTTVNLAAALARAGARVLVIDMDPQGNASTALGVDHRSEQQSVYEVLVQDLPLGPVIRPSAEHERLDCVPATIHLAGAEIELVSLVAREQRLRRALDTHLGQMVEPYHYVFIDCPPSLGLLTINAFVAAREVLIPIQCEYYALEGLSQLLSNIELIEKHLNPSLQLSTILLTMYDSRTNLAQQVAQEVREHFPAQTLGTIIPRSVRVSEAPSYGQSVISYDYGSSGSLSYREAAAEIARRGAPGEEKK